MIFILFFFSVRYLFWVEYDGLYKKHLAEAKKTRIFDYVRDMALDSLKQRLYLITLNGQIVSVHYDGTGQKVIFDEATTELRALMKLGNLLYCTNIISNLIVELNVSSGKIDRFIPFGNGSHPSDVTVVSSLKINGKFYAYFLLFCFSVWCRQYVVKVRTVHNKIL